MEKRLIDEGGCRRRGQRQLDSSHNCSVGGDIKKKKKKRQGVLTLTKTERTH